MSKNLGEEYINRLYLRQSLLFHNVICKLERISLQYDQSSIMVDVIRDLREDIVILQGMSDAAIQYVLDASAPIVGCELLERSAKIKTEVVHNPVEMPCEAHKAMHRALCNYSPAHSTFFGMIVGVQKQSRHHREWVRFDTESRPSADVDRVMAGVAEVGLYAPLTVADADQRYSYGRMILSSGYSHEGASPSSSLTPSTPHPIWMHTPPLYSGARICSSIPPLFFKEIL